MILAFALCFIPELALIFYLSKPQNYGEWFFDVIVFGTWIFLMILFLIVWTTSLMIVYRKIKATGQTVPNKSIFISHISLISLYIIAQIVANLLPLFANDQGTNQNYNIFSTIYILYAVSNTSESLIFILVFYLLLKRGGQL